MKPTKPMTQKERQARYRELKDLCPLVVRCCVCGQQGPKKYMDPHHPHGRHGDNLFNFVWAHRACHNGAHHNVRQSKKYGIITSL